MNYEEAGIKMISEFKKKMQESRLNNKCFDKKGAMLLSAIAYLKGMHDAGAITTEEEMISEFKKKMQESRLNNKCFDKKGAMLLSAIAYLKGMHDAGAITTEEVVEIKRKMIEVIKGE